MAIDARMTLSRHDSLGRPFGAEGILNLSNTNLARLDSVLCGEAGCHAGRVTGCHAIAHVTARECVQLTRTRIVF